MENFSLVNFHNLLGNPLIPIQDLNTNFLLLFVSLVHQIRIWIEEEQGDYPEGYDF